MFKSKKSEEIRVFLILLLFDEKIWSLYCCKELDQLLRYLMWCVGLLRDTIILDTVCLSEAAKRVTPKDRHILHTLLSKVKQPLPMIVNAIVGDLGSGSVSQMYGSGSFPFLIKVLSGLK